MTVLPESKAGMSELNRVKYGYWDESVCRLVKASEETSDQGAHVLRSRGI